MFTEIRLNHEEPDKDKVYVFFSHPAYFELVRQAAKTMVDVYPQVIQVLSNQNNNSIMIQIKKGTFPAIYDQLQSWDQVTKQIEGMSLGDLKIASKYGTTDPDKIAKMKVIETLFKGIQ